MLPHIFPWVLLLNYSVQVHTLKFLNSKSGLLGFQKLDFIKINAHQKNTIEKMKREGESVGSQFSR